VPVIVRNGTHKLVVEGLVQNKERSVVTTSGSDVTDYASYLPIYHNESYVVFLQKYVSLFITLDNLVYVVPANSPGVYNLQRNSFIIALLLHYWTVMKISESAVNIVGFVRQMRILIVTFFCCYVYSVISYRWCHARLETCVRIYDNLCPSKYSSCLSFTVLKH